MALPPNVGSREKRGARSRRRSTPLGWRVHGPRAERISFAMARAASASDTTAPIMWFTLASLHNE